MRSKYIVLLLLLFSSAARAAVFPTGPSVTVGGRTFTDLANLIILIGNNTGSSAITTLRKATGNVSAGYQVTTGKTLSICALIWTNQSTGSDLRLGYADTDTGLSGSIGTNPIYIGGSSANFLASGQAGTSGIYSQVNLNFGVPSQKYLFINNGSNSATFLAYGYEAHDCTQ